VSQFIQVVKELTGSVKIRRYLREFSSLLGGTGLEKASRFGAQLVGARILGPTAFGVWNLLKLVLVYGHMFTLGVMEAMSRDLPLFRGREETERQRKLSQTGLTVTIMSALVVGTVYTLGVSVGTQTALLPIALTAILFSVAQGYKYLNVHLKAYKRFIEQGRQKIVLGFLFLPLVTGFGWWLDLPGYILGQIIAMGATGLFVLTRNRNIELAPGWDVDVFRGAVRSGVFLLLVSVLFNLFTTVDRLIVGAYLGAEKVGFYSLAIMLGAAFLTIPRVVGQQVYPRMSEDYGATGDGDRLLEWARKQTVIVAGVTTTMGVALFFAIPPLVEFFLPRYIPGIDAVRIMLGGLVVLPLWNGYGMAINVLDKQRATGAILLVVLILNLGLNLLFINRGYGIEGVAIATSVSYLVFTGLVITAAWYLIRVLDVDREMNPDD
jgi:O-antigen/teichoic acid export membrane protein